HSPLPVIEQCLANVGRVLAPGGWFDFTFDRTEGEEHHVLRADFYYRTETLTGLAARYGLAAHLMEDWERLPHGQSKIRVTHADRPAPPAAPEPPPAGPSPGPRSVTGPPPPGPGP